MSFYLNMNFVLFYCKYFQSIMCTIKLYNINKHKIQPDYFGSSLKFKYSKGNNMRKKIFFRCKSKMHRYFINVIHYFVLCDLDRLWSFQISFVRFQAKIRCINQVTYKILPQIQINCGKILHCDEIKITHFVNLT